MERPFDCDVLVLGAGNAAICAALAAHEQAGEPTVVVVEKAPFEERGGNTRYTTGAIRFGHGWDGGIDDVKALMPQLNEEELASVRFGGYGKDDFYNDLMRVTEGKADAMLSELLVNEAFATLVWMSEKGVEFQVPVQQAMARGRPATVGTYAMTKGAGLGLSDGLFACLEAREIPVVYETRATELLIDDSARVYGARLKDGEGFYEARAKAVVLGCGGFEANPELRVRYLGPKWNLAKVRGTRHNMGEGLMMALDIGAQPFGHWSGCHATPVDADAPDPGTLVLTDRTRRSSYAWGIMVNDESQRFVDEGEDFMPYTYAKMGAIILEQPHELAFQIFDQKTIAFLEQRYYATATPVEADTMEELGERLGLDPQRLVRTVEEFNAAVDETVSFDRMQHDSRSTPGITPVKTNWAQKLDSPPFVAYPATCGITFTFGGLKITESSQVLDNDDNVIPGLYACGEIAGGFFYFNYPGGSGLTRGSVTGRIAGTTAAAEALGPMG